MSFPFYIVDVFAERKYAGNQLAVIRHAAPLTTAEMQTIAKEMNYSETTFILTDEPQDGGYQVRIFTPEEEVPFAGHPTLGSAYIIQQMIAQKPLESLNLNLKVGQIPVNFSYKEGHPDVMWMKQVPPTFGQTFQAGEVAPWLNLTTADIDDRYPIQIVSTGIPFIIVPLKTLATVKRSRMNVPFFLELATDLPTKAVLIFCPETYEPQNTLNARMFADYYGVPEDPATGSANGCLAGYLVKYKYWGTDTIDIQVEQGYEIGRPSLLKLKAVQQETHIEVLVGGKVILVAKGELV